MLEIFNPQPHTMLLLGNQNAEQKKYRPFFYIHTLTIDDGLLVLNVLTDELIWLSEEEKKYFAETYSIDNPIVRKLIESWFLVPIDFDDLKLVNQLKEMRRMFSQGIKTDFINQYTIYTTTDCNARCYYCYEHGCKRIKMSSQTATDVADFIIKKSKGNKVYITWFGGEPLYNSEVIDIICDILKENNIIFESSMVTNGYLFKSDDISKYIDDWHLNSVQVAIDGTEKVYNKIKAYIYKNSLSPFKIVTDNIEMLLKKDIKVALRIHFGIDNVIDIEELMEYLINRYNKYSNCYIYPQMILDFKSRNMPSDEVRRKIYDVIFKYTKRLIDEKMYNRNALIAGDVDRRHCMADIDSATTILPDGKLGKCECYLESDFWGSIYSDIVDKEVLQSFKELRNDGDNCDNCEWMPFCRHLVKCGTANNFCYEPEKERVFKSMDFILKERYQSFKKGEFFL